MPSRTLSQSAVLTAIPRTTLTGTDRSTGTNLTSKVPLFMFGWQRRF